jgi:hypothetical protein
MNPPGPKTIFNENGPHNVGVAQNYPAPLIKKYEAQIASLEKQVKELLENLATSKAGALRYQIKFETLSELFDRTLNSLNRRYE